MPRRDHKTMTKLLFVVLVALANLGLGFATALVMGFVPAKDSRGIPAFRDPNADPIAPGKRGEVDFIADPPEVRVEAGESGESAATVPLSGASESSEAAPPTANVVAKVDSQVKKCALRLLGISQSLSQTEPPVSSLESFASEVDGIAQHLLKQFNTAMDELRQLEEHGRNDATSREALVQHLDAAWCRFNDLAVRLVMLTFDEESIGESSSQLATVSNVMQRACQEIRESLALPEPALAS